MIYHKMVHHSLLYDIDLDIMILYQVLSNRYWIISRYVCIVSLKILRIFSMPSHAQVSVVPGVPADPHNADAPAPWQRGQITQKNEDLASRKLT